jgi:murein DD-endopeptidase MepM/ murein hydrolase activator NlpD
LSAGRTIFISFSIFLLTLIIVTSCNNENEEVVQGETIVKTEIDSSVIAKKDTQFIYGFNRDSFLVFESIIKKNDFLSVILPRFSVDYNTIQLISKASKEVYDIRKIQIGKKYAVLSSPDSTGRIFVYEPDKLHYVVYDFSNPDSIVVAKHEKEIELVENTASGVINSSLYMTLQAQEIPIIVAMKMADMYAWSIDFYRIQKGDRFKVIYEAQYVDDEFAGIGKIKAAIFYHRDEPYYAFYFETDSISDYYDENGNSLRKAFLKAPVQFSRISSRYSTKRFHPVLKRNKAHLGTDYAARAGTPIMTTGDGVVIARGYTNGNGNYVKVKHNGTYTTQYLHMSKFKSDVKKGSHVKQGDIIGYVGSTGLATGPHVCYRFWKNGKQVDPLREKIPPSKPIEKQYRQQFEERKEKLIKQLESIE